MSTKQEILSDATFKAWLFSSDFDFSCKDGQVTAATWKYYCPLAANPTITNCCKEIHLKCGRVSYICFWKCHHAWKLVRFCVKTSLFLISKYCFIGSYCVLLWYFLWWHVFDQPFTQLLPLSCFYGSSQCLFKVKVSFKWVNFIKK